MVLIYLDTPEAVVSTYVLTSLEVGITSSELESDEDWRNVLKKAILWD